MADPLPDAVEAVVGEPVAKRDQVAVAQEETDWIGHDHVSVKPRHPHRHEYLMAKHLHLGPLVRGRSILERQVADLKHVADHADRFGVVQALDVDPDHRPLLACDGEFLRPQHDGFLAGLAVAAEHPQGRDGQARCRHGPDGSSIPAALTTTAAVFAMSHDDGSSNGAMRKTPP